MASQPVDPDNLAPGTQVGFYRVVRRVGAGGFGTLYEIERDGRRYALKLSRERLGSMSAADRARFEHRMDREVAAVKQISHPHIVKVHAIDRYPDLETGHPYLVMDFVEGEELGTWCANRSPSPAAICGVFEKLARAVDYMHQRQIYHRDLKSQNVLVRQDGEPVIIDFGVSRSRSSFRLTRHEAMVGTETHWAPEYLRHRETDAYEHGEEFQWTPATDLHSVGYMLYEALTGRPPFQGNDDLRLWRAIRDDVPALPSAVNPAVPQPLDAVVMKLLEKDPLERHHSGQELAEELRKLVEKHGQEDEWRQPLSIPATAGAAETVVRSVPAVDGDLAGIDELEHSPIALAAAEMVREAEAGNHTALPPVPATAAKHEPSAAKVAAASPGGPSASARFAMQDLRDKAARAVAPPHVLARPALVGSIAIAVLVLAGVILVASQRRQPQKPTSLMAKVARESAGTNPAVAPPQPSPRAATRDAVGPLPSAPSLADARAIDRELEARYGGRPTVTADGTITVVPQAPSATRSELATLPPSSKGGAPATATPAALNFPAPQGASPEEPAWLKRSTRLDRKVLVAQQTALAPAKPLGVPTGSHIAARLLTTLDSRTVGSGPVEAKLSRPFVVRGEVVLPAGTLAFGRASATEGRFVVRFDRLRLPDDREVEFAALAMDREDGRPGLAASRRLPGEHRRQGEGIGVTIARNSADTVLGTISGGLTQDLVREAGHVALQPGPPEASGSTDVEILDPGLVFDLWVEKPF